MELNQIDAFLAVYRASSFSNAATVLHLSQPAISRRISLLEQDLGASLFERERGGPRLTPAGEAFLPHALAVRAATLEAVAAVQSLQADQSEAVRLCMVGTLASTGLTRQLIEFRRDHPEVRLQLRTARSAEVSQFVRSGEAHLGLRYFPDPAPDLEGHRCMDEDLVVVCGSGSDWPGDRRLSPRELVGTPWITFPLAGSGEPFAESMKYQLRRCGLANADLIVIDSLTAQKRMVEAGFGLSLVPVSSIEEELRLGALRVLQVPEMETKVPVVLIQRKGANHREAVQSLRRLFVK